MVIKKDIRLLRDKLEKTIVPQSFTKEQNQATFDLIAKHLLSQNSKATDHCTLSNGTEIDEPKYFSSDTGKKCSAGICIPDSLYKAIGKNYLEGKTLKSKQVQLAIAFAGHCPELVQDLQTLHDEINCNEWYSHLIALCHLWELKWNLQ